MDFICYKTGKNLEIIKPIIEDCVPTRNGKTSSHSYYRAVIFIIGYSKC